MKVLELFAGTRSISKAFEENGHEVVSVDLDKRFKDCIHRDAYSYTLEELNDYDVVWASPDCRTYSIATSKHRLDFFPVTEYAIYCDEHNNELMDKLKQIKGLYFVENPQGRLRHMYFMEGMPRFTVTYCQYGYPYRKATDIFTNHPNPQFKPPCKRGADCHIHSRSGNSDLSGPARAHIPEELAKHIVLICEQYYDNLR